MIDYRTLMIGNEGKKPLKFPFSTETCFLKMLSAFDEIEITKKADALYAGRELNFCNAVERNSYKVACAVQLFVVDENGKPIFPTVDDLLKTVDKKTINILQDQYNIFIDEMHPNLDEFTDKDISNLITDIKKNLNIIWTISDCNLLRKLVHFMAVQQEI